LCVEREKGGSTGFFWIINENTGLFFLQKVVWCRKFAVFEDIFGTVGSGQKRNSLDYGGSTDL